MGITLSVPVFDLSPLLPPYLPLRYSAAQWASTGLTLRDPVFDLSPLLPPLPLRYSAAQWASTGLTLRGPVFDLSPLSTGGRLLALGAAFAALLLICMYTASYSAGQVTRLRVGGGLSCFPPDSIGCRLCRTAAHLYVHGILLGRAGD